MKALNVLLCGSNRCEQWFGRLGMSCRHVLWGHDRGIRIWPVELARIRQNGLVTPVSHVGEDSADRFLHGRILLEEGSVDNTGKLFGLAGLYVEYAHGQIIADDVSQWQAGGMA